MKTDTTIQNAIEEGKKWFYDKNWDPFNFQLRTWEAIMAQQSGLLNTPTGSGKTYAIWIGCLLDYMRKSPQTYQDNRNQGLQIIWITPLRALTKDIQTAMLEVVRFYGIPWEIKIQTGDTSSREKQKIREKPPECLITTPESLHLMLSQKNNRSYFHSLKTVVVDEWHELLGTKRAVQVELALSRLKNLTASPLRIWGISATIGNLSQAAEVLIPSFEKTIIKAELDKKIR